jgi:Suppressor of fused protein (SUFU)
MPIVATCSHCGRQYTLSDSFAGKKARCKTCQQVFTIPLAHQKPDEVTAGGVPVFRPEKRVPPKGQEMPAITPFMPQIERHLTRHVGPIAQYFHEIVSDEVHIDLMIIPPTNQPPSEEHPLGTYHYTIATAGLSAKPQNVSPKARADGVSPFQELMIALPADWPGMHPDGKWDDEAMKRRENWWPMYWLKAIARMPHEYNTFLARFVTIPSSEDAKPYAPNTRLGCMMIFPPMLSPRAHTLRINDQIEMQFWSLWPLYPEEMNMKLQGKMQQLFDAFVENEMTELIRPDRPNYGKKRGWFGK